MPREVRINETVRRAARALAALFAGLYALFALDTAVLSVGFPVRLALLALVLAGAVIAWNQTRSGVRGFAVGAVASVLLLRTWSSPERFLLLTLPLLVIAGLFGLARDPARPPPGPAADRGDGRAEKP